MTVKPKVQVTLTPINLNDQKQYQELQHQRRICGWKYTTADLDKWRSEIAAKTKSLFWVYIPNPPHHSTTKGTSDIQDHDGSKVCAGHASLDSAVDPPNLAIANPDRSLLTIATFFIYPAYQSLGVGRAVMDVLESWATQAPYGSKHCEAIALHTVSRRYTEDDGPEGRGFWDRVAEDEVSGVKEKGRSNEDWYARRGYVKGKEAPAYPVRMKDGSVEKLVAVYMRKELR